MNRRGFFGSMAAAAIALAMPIIAKAKSWARISRTKDGFLITLEGSTICDGDNISCVSDSSGIRVYRNGELIETRYE